MTGPRVGEVWSRIDDGKAPVRIGRVWHYMGGDLHVRVEPVRGGRWWFAPVAEFVKRYEAALHRQVGS